MSSSISKPAPPRSVGARAEELRRAVRERARRETTGTLVQGLTTRRDEILDFPEAAEELRRQRQLLRAINVRATLPAGAISRLTAGLAELRHRLALEPAALTEPNALPLQELRLVLAEAREA